MLKNDKQVGIGAIDCDLEKATCAKYGVSGYPTIKAILGGKGKSYNGARESEPMKEYIQRLSSNRGTKGGSAKCPLGMFKSKLKDSVVPLCEEHFPDDKAKNAWMVFFYEGKSASAADLKSVANTLASELGNFPADMNKALKTQTKRRDRLNELARKYDLALKLPPKGPFGMEALIKIGAVCCDCSDDTMAFCDSSLRIGEDNVKAPQVFWVENGQRTLLEGVDFSSVALAQRAIQGLGFSALHQEKAKKTSTGGGADEL
mmetsp:Transcript_9593/g.24726  ORF Transcript_9593/g.24726 Transcript_9593/m.24726 type:complete len:260 (+) Transcript_9593:316-1095(+)|eukprot:CAMPEP_0183445830 /NCGR_PEP_ID=MMETSP0370-20130417/96552_1 /TAXON_ID=268820 /ORGANISM="Peridinium aciculiferum, Strain PAER-2" /LENGTH=259 /DNA_ID=CAMNT_0025636471 /DNA_START=308 /DNA_END=1087 /DNA_ORIENTATION=-